MNDSEQSPVVDHNAIKKIRPSRTIALKWLLIALLLTSIALLTWLGLGAAIRWYAPIYIERNVGDFQH